MTRHSLTPHDPKLVRSVTVGWDRPTRSFFGDVLATEPDGDGEESYLYEAPLWDPLSTIIDNVARYAKIPDELVPALRADAKLGPDSTTAQSSQRTTW
ncbi:MAG TPA: hypothetical protein VGL46_09685 [Pseudonocardiaceae bacterium]|jgi:hypothetical protein